MKQTCNKSSQILVWEASLNIFQSYFIRGLQTLQNNINLEASHPGFSLFSRVENPPDKTLKLVIEPLLENFVYFKFL